MHFWTEIVYLIAIQYFSKLQTGNCRFPLIEILSISILLPGTIVLNFSISFIVKFPKAKFAGILMVSTTGKSVFKEYYVPWLSVKKDK
ncbi:hypothetical protein IX38_13365 [Chryseobacterium luteum]|uniref:Uncharacterized protein n=1 Tax=Chryseobacterium luteum TaxID=421531 RepID=A0A085ZDR6_9FLAO|nr:hypothetical protein IX38_13365 [Chryseobacterium luteum]